MEYESHNNPDADAESDDPKDKSKKKKKASGLGSLIAGKNVAAELPASEAKQHSEKADKETAWQKLSREVLNPKDEDEKNTSAKAAATDAENADVEAANDNAEDLEKLSSDEQQAVVLDYLNQRSQELTVDADGEDPEAAAARQANLTFLQRLRERLMSRNPDEGITDQVDAAFEDATAEFAPDDVDFKAEDLHVDSVIEVEADIPQEFEPDEPLSLSSSSSSTGRGGAGSGSTITPSQFMYPQSGGAGRSSNNWIYNAQPASAQSKNMVSEDDAQYYEKRAMQQGVVAGGVVGYLLGRRRGRIKTEKKFQSVQAKLEKQVKEVQQQVIEHEVRVQQLARQNQQLTAKAKSAELKTPAERVLVTPAAMPLRAEAIVSAATRPESSPGETSPTQPPFNRSEQMPYRQPESYISRPMANPEAPRAQPTANQPERHQLARADLLNYSGQIRLGETNLRRVYEAKLVDEPGLRRLVQAYEAGHDLRRALAREFLAKELRFERDPRLNGGTPDANRPSGGGAAVQPTNDMTLSTNPVPITPPSTFATSTSSRQHKSPLRRQQTNISPALLAGLVLITIALALYAIWLTFTH